MFRKLYENSGFQQSVGKHFLRSSSQEPYCHEMKCDICHFTDDNPTDYGDFLNKSGVTVHYYCMLLSKNLPQLGKLTTSGLLGFQIKDLKIEISAATKRKCCYCNVNGASLQCYTCEIYFHLICGTKNSCLLQFVDEFKTFCHKHHGVVQSRTHEPNEGCYICLKNMGTYNPITSMMALCCSYGWVHRKCLRQYALTAGYYLKCLWCRCPKFRDEIRLLGVFVPDRDAFWELEKDAFAGLHRGYSNCDAVYCVCPKGRDYKQGTKWIIHVCNTCGAFGLHKHCAGDILIDGEFRCNDCESVFNRTSCLNSKSPISKSLNQKTMMDQSMYMTKSQSIVIFAMPDDKRPIHRPSTSSNGSSEICSTVQFDPAEHTTNLKAKNNTSYLMIDMNKKSIIGVGTGTRNPECNKNVLTPNDILFTSQKIFKDEDPQELNSLNDILLQLIKEEKSKTPLHDKAISVSDSESSISANELMERGMAKENIEVPRPKVMEKNRQPTIVQSHNKPTTSKNRLKSCPPPKKNKDPVREDSFNNKKIEFFFSRIPNTPPEED